MEPDDDLAKLLPEAPPRPDRREAAIAEALRRFDGEAPSPAPPRRRPVFAWPSLGRPQMGALISMGLLAVIGVPLSLMTVREQQREAGEQALPSRKHDAGPSGVTPPAAPADLAERAPPPAIETPAKAPPAADAPAETTEPRPEERGEPIPAAAPPQRESAMVLPAPVAPMAPAAPPPPPAPPPAALADAARARPGGAVAKAAAPESRDVIVTGAANSRGFSLPPAAAASAEADARAEQSIVVSGARTSRAARRAARRGDWNACTVDDPAPALDRCRREVNPGAKGAAGRAAARIADGLVQAWDGQPARAITAFDAAIAIDPRRAFAYLNRGLAYRRLGDTERAAREFDQAVRYAPDDPRGYYHRSLALRALGNTRRARDDEARATRLDERYADIIE